MIQAFRISEVKKSHNHIKPSSFSHVLQTLPWNPWSSMTSIVFSVSFLESSNSSIFSLYFVDIGIDDVEIVSSRSRVASAPLLLDMSRSGKVAEFSLRLPFPINLLIIFGIWQAEYWICSYLTILGWRITKITLEYNHEISLGSFQFKDLTHTISVFWLSNTDGHINE